MCCLFGLLDYGKTMSLKRRQQVLRVLSKECEVRGTDATGIAYFTGTHLTIQKAPRPAHRMRFHLPGNAHYIMGHTRMTTQGSEKKNCNNHPFPGKAGSVRFALAHNGMLSNDQLLKQTHHLPYTQIETDSYVAVQLLEQVGQLDFDSLQRVSEKLQGTFTLTLLDQENSLYIVKGNNPLCIYHDPKAKFYLYASTREILERALRKLNLRGGELFQPVQGEILKIASDGQRETHSFDDSNLRIYPRSVWQDYDAYYDYSRFTSDPKQDYLDEVLDYAAYLGVPEEELNALLDAGYDALDIEELIYDPVMRQQCLQELLWEQCM